MRVLHITGIPETYKIEDISNLIEGLDIDSVFIELRKDESFQFKGTVFMKPSTKEQSEALLNEDTLKCNGEPLKIIERGDFLKDLKRDKRERRDRPKRNERNDNVERDEKKEAPERERRQRPKFQLDRKERAIFHFTGASENTHFQDIKSTFSAQEKVAWVDYRIGDEEGYVRFMEDGAAERAIEFVKKENDGKVLVDDVEFNVRILEGEEEEEYWRKTEDIIENIRRRRYFRSRRDRDSSYGGRRFKRRPFERKRRQGDEENDERDDISNDERGDRQPSREETNARE